MCLCRPATTPVSYGVVEMHYCDKCRDRLVRRGLLKISS
jgi:hypothetical protein